MAQVGRGAFALAVFGGTAACAAGGGEPAVSPPPAAPPAPAPSAAPGGSAGTVGTTDWRPVDLGFVFAYVLVRNGEAAVVDTGVEGSAPAIQEALAAGGADWGSVGHVILTHKHGDHAGSAGVVAEQAPDATLYTGAADVGAITAPRPVTPLNDGDMVFDLRVVATPGHTPGHIAVLDPSAGGVLLTGDSIGASTGQLSGPNPQYSEDMATANESVRKLATLSYDTVLFGHGQPILTGGSARVGALAAGL